MQRQGTQDSQVDIGGTRVLLVEDEYYIADDVRRTLRAAGAEVVGPVGTVASASEAVAHKAFDCAVVDLNLHGESAEGVAERLIDANKPFALATGYGSGAVPERLKDVPRIEKPFDPSALLLLVKQLGAVRP